MAVWGAQSGGCAGRALAGPPAPGHCHQAPSAYPKDSVCQLCSAPELLPLLRMVFSKFGYKPQLPLFQHVCSLLIKFDQRTESGFPAVAGEFCSAIAHRYSTLQVPDEKDGICKPKCIPTLLSSCSTLSICMWTALLLEGELENSSASGNNLLREIHTAKEPSEF